MPQKNPTDNLTKTSNYFHSLVHTDDYEEDYLLKWNLVSNDDEENYLTEDPINPYKLSPSATETIETDILSHIAAVSIVVTTAPVFNKF